MSMRELLSAKIVDGKLTQESLDEVALLVRRAGIIVLEATRLEAEALARAGERLAEERVALLVLALRNPSAALSPFDGGQMKRDELMSEAWGMIDG